MIDFINYGLYFHFVIIFPMVNDENAPGII